MSKFTLKHDKFQNCQYLYKILVMKKIVYELSDGLFNKLEEIRITLSKDENQDVSVNDVIEEAILEHYKIKITDINYFNEIKIEDATIIDTINNNRATNNYYVYVYYNMRKEVDIRVGNFYLYYEPIYFGKGKNGRISDMNNRDTNLIERINELKSTNDFSAVKLIENVTEIDAYHIEQVFINYFGRLDNGTGILFNKNYGGSTILRKVDNGELNLEFQKVSSMLKALNSSGTINIAAKKINMNLRTFYRLIKKYHIKRDKSSNSWIIDNL
jgi:hypothetical protein